jgi:hypothetical protein
VTYRAGRGSNPPFAVVTVAHGIVLEVRWAFQTPCERAYPMPDSGTDKIRAKIGKHGRFAKTINYSSPGEQGTTPVPL